VKAKLISVITEATRTFSKSIRKYLSNITGKHEIKEQKYSHTGHCTRTAERANVKYKTYFSGEVTLHVAQVVNTELQHYRLQKRGLFQVYSSNCLALGNNK